MALLQLLQHGESTLDTSGKIPVAITATFGIVAIYLHCRHKMVPMPGKRNQRTILSWSCFHLAKGQLLWPVFRTCGIMISSGTAKKKHKGTRYWFPVYLYRESPYDLESKPFFSTANRSQSLHLGIFYQIDMFFPICFPVFLCSQLLVPPRCFMFELKEFLPTGHILISGSFCRKKADKYNSKTGLASQK